MKIIKLIKTCDACPAQWEGKLEDGRMLYFRYRYGHLSVRISPEVTDDIMDAVDGEEIFGTFIGDELDGSMSEEELLKAITPMLKQ